MRGIPSLITDIRKKVFVEVARMAYAGNGYEAANELPYKIVPGDRPLHRESAFLERAIAGERVRLAMGLSLRPSEGFHLVTEGMDAAAVAEQYYEPPPGQHHPLRLPRLPHQPVQGHQVLPELPCPLLREGLPQGRH